MNQTKKILTIVCVLALATVLVFSAGCDQPKKKKSKKGGSNVEILIDKGLAAERAGKSEEAMKYYTKAIKKNPNKSGKAYLHRASLRRNSGNMDGAMSDFKKAADLLNDMYSAQQVAAMYRERGDMSNAAAWDAKAGEYQQQQMNAARENISKVDDRKRAKRQARERESQTSKKSSKKKSKKR